MQKPIQGTCIIKLFSVVFILDYNKLVCLSLSVTYALLLITVCNGLQ